MDIATKLQLRPSQRLKTVNAPLSLTSSLPSFSALPPSDDAALLVFVLSRADLDAHRDHIVDAASNDLLTWVAYPKAGRLATDLNRDSLAATLTSNGLQPVRQIALDDVWSALRFRPRT